ncbi:hypothetical protein Nepgr_020851 [Nepenthes gracilis]|uniref:Choline transporter-like protein n=1 Tax=Nepenthes gracilis TaxID=150966 RepID=A0AAD3SW20_NEPGR|nr:hypothetical protein Nepgr_020851 [Nepenthes gracilis]
MGALEESTEEERENGNKAPERKEEEREETGAKDMEKDEMGFQEQVIHPDRQADSRLSMLQRLNPSNPLRIVINGGSRVTTPPPPPPPQSQPRFTQTPTPQQSMISLNSSGFTNKITLFLFLVHMVVAIGLVGFLIFKGIQGFLVSENVRRKEKKVLKYFLPQVEAAALLSITLAFTWQKAVRLRPRIMVHFIIWSSFAMSLAAGILLICFQKPATNGVGACLVLFAIGNGLYACWVTQRTGFCSKILIKSLEPVSQFHYLNRPTYLMLGAGFIWMSLWILAVIGALNFYFPPLIIIALVLSLTWTAEVMRNVANLTVSRVIALYYLRGVKSSTQFCFQRALTLNLGSACLGSLFVPSIEALRILARGLNLLEGEDEFMFSCAHCCLDVMQSVFKYGNGWAFVQVAAYGKIFTRASIDTWALFESRGMETLVDSDITSSVCFLSGVCTGSICTIMVAAWTAKVHQGFTATISVLAFFIGYLMTRIAMALPHACVSCYYVCYAENPQNRMFDNTIPTRISKLKSDRGVAVPTPRVPHRFQN